MKDLKKIITQTLIEYQSGDILKNGDYVSSVKKMYFNEVAETIVKNLSLSGVVASVLCVDSKDYNFITLDSKYELVKEGLEYMTIYDNDGDLSTYEKECFKKL